MTSKKALYPKTRWHRILAGILEEWLTPVGIKVQSEVPISSNPPTADILLLKNTDEKLKKQQYLRLSDGLRNSRASQFLLEFKYTESLNEAAVLQLLGYRSFYLSSQKLKPKDLDCFLLCSQTPRQKTLDHLGYVETKVQGVYRSASVLVSHVTLLSLNELSDEAQNIPLKCFASKRTENKKAYHSIQADKLKGMTIGLEWLFNGLWKLLFREVDNMSAIAEIEELTPEYVKEVGKEWVDHLIKALPPEERMKGLRPEERLNGLRPEERLNGLEPEERMKGLDPEERLKGLEPGDRIKGLEPEERIKGLNPSEIISALSPEELKKLKEELKGV